MEDEGLADAAAANLAAAGHTHAGWRGKDQIGIRKQEPHARTTGEGAEDTLQRGIDGVEEWIAGFVADGEHIEILVGGHNLSARQLDVGNAIGRAEHGAAPSDEPVGREVRREQGTGGEEPGGLERQPLTAIARSCRRRELRRVVGQDVVRPRRLRRSTKASAPGSAPALCTSTPYASSSGTR